ncbi:MAG: DoxX family protein [Bacteroidia bacterium]|nr:DoxX family protein [Bacteroidia bacterium]NND26332.1 DoxX family protein [Flavobacteriaceae bacterium]NNL33681.1 DoxX family protein [Flavobacteriaceae bacterium]RZW43385.1 MAG: DoxX family protein [Flavobacteriaceae bacterium]
MIKKRLLLILRFAVAIILVQTLRFKFTAHPDSVYIFETIGLEPYGRIGTGILELIAGILLLIPKTVWAGALLTIGLMTGAILMHLTQIGIEVNNDKGVLFITAVVTLVIAAVLLLNFKKEIPFIGSKL